MRCVLANRKQKPKYKIPKKWVQLLKIWRDSNHWNAQSNYLQIQGDKVIPFRFFLLCSDWMLFKLVKYRFVKSNCIYLDYFYFSLSSFPLYYFTLHFQIYPDLRNLYLPNLGCFNCNVSNWRGMSLENGRNLMKSDNVWELNSGIWIAHFWKKKDVDWIGIKCHNLFIMKVDQGGGRGG